MCLRDACTWFGLSLTALVLVDKLLQNYKIINEKKQTQIKIMIYSLQKKRGPQNELITSLDSREVSSQSRLPCKTCHGKARRKNKTSERGIFNTNLTSLKREGEWNRKRDKSLMSPWSIKLLTGDCMRRQMVLNQCAAELSLKSILA